MPLTKKAGKMKKAMTKSYGKKKSTKVFYATAKKRGMKA